MDKNIYLSLSEYDPEMVSWIYNKTSSRGWIETPKNILLKIKEINSIGWNIQNHFPPGTTEMGSGSSHGSGLYQQKNNQVFDTFFMTNI